MSGVKVGGSWRTPAVTYVKVAGVWRTVATVSVKVAGTWRTSTFADPPAKPTLNHHTTAGQFIITNYSPSLIYTATLVSGSGSATLNTSTGVYTLSSQNARFSVTAKYAAGTSESTAGYMERAQYTTTATNVDVSYIHGLPQHGVINYGGYSIPGSRWTYCLEASYGGECPHQEGTNVKNATPSGYTDSYGEWWRVS